MSKTLRVVLVCPPAIAVVEPWNDRPNWGRIALAYLAGYLRQYPDYEITLIDSKLERLSFEETHRRLVELKPDVVGFTAFTSEIKPAAYQASLLKEALPHVVTLVGGAHVTALPQQTLREFPGFDLAVFGEGEKTLHELCEALKTSGELRGIPGLAYREASDVVMGPTRERILDQDSIPLPAWDLLPRAEVYWVQTIRGCPFNCLFCMNHNGRVARKRSVENVIREIELIVNTYHPRQIRFGDELFTVDMARTHTLMDAIIASGLHRRVEWDCQTHVRFVDADLLRKMKEANCFIVEMGIETGDEATLRTMGKGTNLEVILRAGDAARAARIRFGIFLILGHPNETLDSLQRTIDLAIELNPDLPMFGIMTPYPGTEISRMAAANSSGYKLVTTDWDEYTKQIGGALEFAGMSRQRIEWIQLTAYCKVFLYNYRFRDFLKFAWHYKAGAWRALLKAVSRRPAVSFSRLKPADYDQRLSSGQAVVPGDIISAREDWEVVQRSELQRAKRASPELLKVVTIK